MKNRCCFIDTGAFIALNIYNDQHYSQALDIARTLEGYRFYISDLVISETYSFLRYKVDYFTASQFMNTIIDNSYEYEIVSANQATRIISMELLEKYCDHKISYCDALTISLMKQLNIKEIFAFDYHFTMMGMKRIGIDT